MKITGKPLYAGFTRAFSPTHENNPMSGVRCSCLEKQPITVCLKHHATQTN